MFFFFNDTATTEIYTLSLHDALPISQARPPRPTWDRIADTITNPSSRRKNANAAPTMRLPSRAAACTTPSIAGKSAVVRSEEHTSELQSLAYLVCRLLLEKKHTTSTN